MTVITASGYGGDSIFGGGAGRNAFGGLDDYIGYDGGFGGGGGGQYGSGSHQSNNPNGRGGNGGFGGGGGGSGGGTNRPQVPGVSLGFGGSGGTQSSESNNRAGGGGGGAGLGGAVFIKQGTLTLRDSSFESNEAQGGTGGLGRWGKEGEAGRGSPGQGVGGAVFVYQDAEISVTNTVFNNNKSDLVQNGLDDIYINKIPDSTIGFSPYSTTFNLNSTYEALEDESLLLSSLSNMLLEEAPEENGSISAIVFDSGSSGKIFYKSGVLAGTNFTYNLDVGDLLSFLSDSNSPPIYPSTEQSTWDFTAIYQQQSNLGFLCSYPVAGNQFYINITAENDLPTIVDASISMDEDTTLTIPASTFKNAYNDYDDNHLFTKIKIKTLPNNGVLKLENTLVNIDDEITNEQLLDGALTFTPETDFPSPASFETVTFEWSAFNDDGVETLIKNLNIRVNDTADSPVVYNDDTIATGGIPVTIDVLFNDRDPLGPNSPEINPSNYSISVLSQPAHGSVTISDQKLVYSPDNIAGPVSFTYNINNGLDSNTGTVTVDVSFNEFFGAAIVDIIDDSDDGLNAPGQTSFREAVSMVGQNGLTRVIFDESLNGSLLTLESSIEISKDIEIDGGNQVTISGGGTTNIFKITSGNVTIRNVTLQDGLSQGGNGGGGSGGPSNAPGGGGAGMGGALAIEAGNVIIENVDFINNKAIGGEGGDTTAPEDIRNGNGDVITASGYGGDSIFGGGARRNAFGGLDDYIGYDGGFGGGGGGQYGSGSHQSNNPNGRGGNGGFGGGGGGSGGGTNRPQVPGVSLGFGGSGGTQSSESNNRAGGGGGGAGLGGAVFIKQGTLTLRDSSFESNEAQGGTGGLGRWGKEGEAGRGSPGQGVGGAVFVYQDAKLVTRVTTYNNNSAQTSNNDFYIMEGAELDEYDSTVSGIYSGEVTEASNENNSTSGWIEITDIDATDTPQFSDVSIVDQYGTFILTNGNWEYSLNNSDITSLSNGDFVQQEVNLTATDQTQIQIIINIYGSNDAPVPVSDSISAIEDDQVITGVLEASDPDGDTDLVYSLVSPVSGLTINPDGTFSFDPSDPDLQYLAESELLEINASWNVTDGFASDNGSLNISLTGRNDEPTVGDLQIAAIESSYVISGQIESSDPEGDTITYSYSNNHARVSGFLLEDNGEFTFDPSVDDYQYLVYGQNLILKQFITYTDGFGTENEGFININLSGTNFNQLASASTEAVIEDSGIKEGQLTASVDSTPSSGIEFSLVSDLPGFALAADGKYTFDTNHSDYDYLNLGVNTSVSATWNATDLSTGEIVTSNIEFLITGSNDDPEPQAISIECVCRP